MSGDQIASFVYLGLLGTVIAGYFFLSHRGRMGQGLRQLGLWALIFIGVIAGYGLWGDIQGTVLPRQAVMAEDGRIEIPLGPDGHYHLLAEVNGEPIRFVVDTGASDIVLGGEDAARAGVETDDLGFSGVAQTANGRVRTARVWLDSFSIGGLVDEDVPAVVTDGEMPGSLLGMRYLNTFGSVEFGGGEMVLTR
ncbi:TIGR02281 family clan AA aspartic protease [Roseicyclus sp. F158]|uniref:TIGR02281 family clan AA aspartic protease n=1 Tax=Tropicimonas omnivorans TaxID=3075590 RepID=A0ABU3DIP2_9RHOB|nr:TIGR02281 family clan AA aspartic protease [Roseicyclus sp. F158]MDT0683589.1 TIGR02281 family clan AA aspartic protease [Roseicyclus sp. F158]